MRKATFFTPIMAVMREPLIIYKVLKEIYNLLPKEAKIVNSTVTGYGEALLESALKWIFEIETIAHYKAANFSQE